MGNRPENPRLPIDYQAWVRYVGRIGIVEAVPDGRERLAAWAGTVMKRLALFLIAGLFFVPAPSTPVHAADMGVERTRVVRHHYSRERVYLGCSDRYSCYPLYGAYGPYGGRAYWAAYSGW